MGLKTKLYQLIKSVDLYGDQVTFHYKNSSTVKSFIGGFFTILSRLGILAFLLVLLQSVLNMDSVVTFKTVNRSLIKDKSIYNLKLDNFDIAIGIQWFDGKPHIEERLNLNKYLAFQFVRTDLYFTEGPDGSLFPGFQSTQIPLIQCELGRFRGQNESMKALGIDVLGSFCPQTIDIPLQGQASSPEKKMLQLQVSTCRNSTFPGAPICESSANISQFIMQTLISVAHLKMYFDQNNYENPIQNEIIYDFYSLQESQAFTQNIEMRKNLLTSKNNWFSSFFQIKEYEFYEPIRSRVIVQDIKPYIAEMINIVISQSSQEINIERVRITFIDILSIVGGFANIIVITAKLLIQFYQTSYYKEIFISKLFQVHSYEEQFDQKAIKKRNGFKGQKSPMKTISNEEEKVTSLATQIMKVLQSRKKLKMNVFTYQIKKAFSCCKQKRQSLQQKDRIQQIAILKYQKAFDIIQIQKTLMKLKVQQKLLFKGYQRKLLACMNTGLIYAEASKLCKIAPSEDHQIVKKVSNQAIKHKKPLDIEIVKEIIGKANWDQLTTSKTENQAKTGKHSHKKKVVKCLNSQGSDKGTQQEPNQQSNSNFDELTFTREKKVSKVHKFSVSLNSDDKQ